MKILLLGSGAREHALARVVQRSTRAVELHCFASSVNPGIRALCQGYGRGDIESAEAVCAYAKAQTIDMVLIGPEAPLAAGVADALRACKIGVVGPNQQAARIETSKAFARDLMQKYSIPGRVRFCAFSTMDGVASWLNTLGEHYVIKADGLMGGKGVKVAGEHVHSTDEALAYCERLLSVGQGFVIEEKCVGEEFSLLSFSDGKQCVHMPVVQDHKRAFDGDTGPNTGGMGSYSDANHRLPFLSADDVATAQAINEQTIQALCEETGERYQGVLYGGFMAVHDGVRVIEFNARLGDPEAMNVFATLESDFVTLCEGVVQGTLDQYDAQFAEKATVVKYAVPEGYPDAPVKGQPIVVPHGEAYYLAAVDQQGDHLVQTGSRAVAVLGVADSIQAAAALADKAIAKIEGPLFYRHDIGSSTLLKQRVAHMAQLRAVTVDK
jgi:phosphoribosylamine--glycine ligase